MKVKVVEIFRDKYTNEVYELNQELEVDKKRFQEIKNYVEEIEEPKTEEPKAQETEKKETKNKENKNKGE